MRRSSVNLWPQPIELDDDAAVAAAQPATAFEAVKKVLRGVCPALSDDYLMCGPRAGTATTDWMRQCGMYLLAGRLGVNLAEAGRLFRRDRSSIRHGVVVVAEACEASASTALFLEFLENLMTTELRDLAYAEAANG